MKTPEKLAEAVRDYQAGKKESFNKIYELSYRYLHTCVFHILKEEEIVMDILQETYLDISNDMEHLKNSEDFLSWASTIANRKCFQYLRKKRDILLNENEKNEFFESIPDDEKFIPESVLQDREKQKLIKDIIDGLSDMQRLCVIGYFYNEEKQEQIAEELQMPVSTVKSHLNRAKAKIKEAVIGMDEKQGIRLYSVAPFLLLFFAEEAEACELVPMPQSLEAKIYGNEAIDAGPKAGRAGKISKAVKSGLKIKIGIGITVIIAAVTGGLLIYQNMKAADETDSNENLEDLSEFAPEDLNQDSLEVSEEGTAGMEMVDTEPAADEPEENALQGLSISGEYDQIGVAKDGRVLVCKDDKWGMVTYDNQILVPLEYSYAHGCINDDGQVLLGNDGDYRVFDRDGKELFQSEKQIKSVSDGIVLIVEEDRESLLYTYHYLTLDGGLIYEMEEPWYIGQTGAVGFNEGYAIASTDDDEIAIREDGSYTSINEKRAESWYASQPSESTSVVMANGAVLEGSGTAGYLYPMIYPIGIYHNGYYAARGMDFEDTYGNYYVSDLEGTEPYAFRMQDLYEYAGYEFNDADVSWTVYGYSVNGYYAYSYGTILNVALRKNDEVTYYLIDLSKLKWETDEMYMEKIPITEDSLIAVGDYIALSDNKYWLYSEDGKWGYIDHAGNVMEMFDDASGFVNGKAMVVVDGKACFVDEEFNRMETDITADAVRSCGDIFEIVNGDSYLCLDSN